VACVYALTLGPLAVAELWFRAHLAWSGWTTATVAVAGTGGILGLCLMHLWQNRWAPLVPVALALVSVKMWMHFGNPDVANREKAPRPACRQLRARVPQGEELYLYGDVPLEAVFYLDAETFALRTLDSVGHAFICTVPGAKGAVDVPPGTSGAALERVSYGKKELVLLRVEKSGN